VKSNFLIFVFSCLSISSLIAQHELTLFNMNNVFQASYVNPTLVPENKVSIGLPGISSVSLGLYAPFVARDILVSNDGGNTYSYSASKIISKMTPDRNPYGIKNSIDLFHLRFKVRNLYVSLNSSVISDTRINIPKDAFSFLWDGNAQYLGSAAKLDNTSLNATQYTEYAIGFTRAKDNGKLRYGVRLKLLQGLNNFYTERSINQIAGDPSYYQQTISADIITRSASVLNYDNSNDMDITKSMSNFSNLGWGADVGITYLPTRKLSFTAVVNNLGAITWKTNTKSHTINGTYTFEGIQLDSLVASESLGVSSIVDGLTNAFNVQESPSSSYKTKLTPNVFLSTAYSLGRNTKISLTGFTELQNGLRPAGSIAFIQRAGRVLNFLVSYNVHKDSYNNMGFGLMFKPGAVQFYIVGDHIPFNYLNTNNYNIRTGINLVFGKTRKPEMQTHNEE